MGVRFWIRRAVTVFALVGAVLYVVSLAKGRGLVGSAEFSAGWSAASTAVFIAARLVQSRRGLHCALCQDIPVPDVAGQPARPAADVSWRFAMTAYVLAQLTIHDRARYDRYAARFLDVLRPFRGRLLSADESPEVLEGEWDHEKVVLIEFESRDEAVHWAESPAYREIAADREAATVASVLLLSGVQPWTGS